MLGNTVATEVMEVGGIDDKLALDSEKMPYISLVVDNTTSNSNPSGLITDRDKVVFSNKLQKTSGNLARIGIAFDFCKDVIVRTIDAQDDPILKANAMVELQTGLDRLWKERTCREQLFGDLVNVLQGLFLKIEPLDVSGEQLESIKEVLFAASDLAVFSKADIKGYLKILNKAGCDVYRTLR